MTPMLFAPVASAADIWPLTVTVTVLVIAARTVALMLLSVNGVAIATCTVREIESSKPMLEVPAAKETCEATPPPPATMETRRAALALSPTSTGVPSVESAT